MINSAQFWLSSPRCRALLAGAAAAVLAASAHAQNTAPGTAPVVATPERGNSAEPRTVPQAAPDAPRATPPLRVVLLLPLDNALLRRAAQTVRDGAAAVFAARKAEVSVHECAYGADAVVAAYARCVNDSVDWVVGPLGRADVTALALSKQAVVRPTLMLSPLGTTPPASMAVLAPELEAEGEAIAQQAADDACRKPVLVEGGGALATRVAIAISGFWRERIATPLMQANLGARDGWRRMADGWRRDNVDCLLFAGGGSMLAELRPYLRGIVIYATSASYESALDRTMDWTGVRIADAPWIVDNERSDYSAWAPQEALSPTLARLYALGIDAARLTVAAGRDALPTDFDGAIGQLRLRDAQYRRTPMIGEFRERNIVKVGP